MINHRLRLNILFYNLQEYCNNKIVYNSIMLWLVQKVQTKILRNLSSSEVINNYQIYFNYLYGNLYLEFNIFYMEYVLKY